MPATQGENNADICKELGFSDEPDLYLITIRENIPAGTEGEKRQKEYMAWRKKSLKELDAESGNRAEYREIMGTSLLQKLTFRE